MSAISDEQPRASTSKEGAEPRISNSTTAYHDAPAAGPDLRQGVTGSSPSPQVNALTGYSSSLAKLQTYLPTGTWMTYTALQTWAFTLRPNEPPAPSGSNCNAHQRIALVIVLCLSTVVAFFISFIKRFVYDAEHLRVLYPLPDLFNVAHYFTDPITGVSFPRKTKEQRYCWPLINGTGELQYDEKGGKLMVLVFKPGIKIHVKRKLWIKRIWDSWFHPPENVPNAPKLSASPPSKHMSLPSNVWRLDRPGVTVDIDDMLAAPPPLQPRWTYTLLGSYGGEAYVDLRPCVWAHAIVSVLGFLTLALFSTQVSACVYPSIPDYLPPTLQTAMLILISFIAALFIHDDAVSLGQTTPQSMPTVGVGDVNKIPVYLQGVVELLVLFSRQDGRVE